MHLSTRSRSVLFLLLATGAWGEVRIAYPSGGSGCQIVEFPRWALPKNARENHHYPAGYFGGHSIYVFRHVEDSAKDLLLVTVEERWLFDNLASPDKYWLDLSGKPRVRPATDPQWESASPVTGIFNLQPPSHPGGNQPIAYHGQEFPKTGKIWASGDGWGGLSSRGTWLSAGSLTVQKESGDGAVVGALTHVDIYHVATGKQVVALSGTLADFDMNTSKANSGYFLEDRFYVAPVSENRQTMLICDLSHLIPEP
jgi:hypothetical protein